MALITVSMNLKHSNRPLNLPFLAGVVADYWRSQRLWICYQQIYGAIQMLWIIIIVIKYLYMTFSWRTLIIHLKFKHHLRFSNTTLWMTFSWKTLIIHRWYEQWTRSNCHYCQTLNNWYKIKPYFIAWSTYSTDISSRVSINQLRNC